MPQLMRCDACLVVVAAWRHFSLLLVSVWLYQHVVHIHSTDVARKRNMPPMMQHVAGGVADALQLRVPPYFFSRYGVMFVSQTIC